VTIWNRVSLTVLTPIVARDVSPLASNCQSAVTVRQRDGHQPARVSTGNDTLVAPELYGPR